jgi:hypothetical protein
MTLSLHDWTRVEAGILHDFHTVWIAEMRNALNAGLLPPGYYALAEQHAGAHVTDVLTLHATPQRVEPLPPPPPTGGTAVAEAPPRVRLRQTVDPASLALRRTLAIRHVSGHRLIALIEIVSPSNKDRREHVEAFTAKAESALECGVHLLVVDLFPPGPHDPRGIHDVIRRRLEPSAESYELPPGEPQTFVAYVAGPKVEVYLEHAAVGVPLPEMPLFLRPDRYINAPLESTYQAAYRGAPAFWREVLEARPPAP